MGFMDNGAMNALSARHQTVYWISGIPHFRPARPAGPLIADAAPMTWLTFALATTPISFRPTVSSTLPALSTLCTGRRNVCARVPPCAAAAPAPAHAPPPELVLLVSRAPHMLRSDIATWARALPFSATEPLAVSVRTSGGSGGGDDEDGELCLVFDTHYAPQPYVSLQITASVVLPKRAQVTASVWNPPAPRYRHVLRQLVRYLASAHTVDVLYKARRIRLPIVAQQPKTERTLVLRTTRARDAISTWAVRFQFGALIRFADTALVPTPNGLHVEVRDSNARLACKVHVDVSAPGDDQVTVNVVGSRPKMANPVVSNLTKFLSQWPPTE